MLVDLKMAFDTVNDEILIKEFSHYGINNTELKWLCSYPNNSRQC